MMKSINWQTTIVACLICLGALNCQAQSEALPKRAPELRVAAIRAMLFYETNGTFSPDVFTNPVNLWNTTIEGASREGASESMLVTVEIQGEAEALSAPERKVQLTARYRIADVSGRGKAASFSKTLTINIGSDGKFFAGFWLYETGCHPVQLTARLVGQRRGLRKTINLRCGE